MSYNRTNAVKYARKYWNCPASDGFVCTNSAPYFRNVSKQEKFEQLLSGRTVISETIIAVDGSVISWDELDDCSHFISCCLGAPPGEQAGGLPIPREFPNGPYGTLSAQRLYESLVSQNLVEIVAEKMSYVSARPLLNGLSEGDLIFYWNAPKNRYGHSAIYLPTKGNIACHTYSRCDQEDRYNQSWDSVGYGICTLIKVK